MKPPLWSAATVPSTGCAGRISPHRPASPHCWERQTTATGPSLQKARRALAAVISTTRWSSKPRLKPTKAPPYLVDFMPPRGHNPDVIRIVRGVSGSVDMEMELVLRFDYGRSVPWVTACTTAPCAPSPDLTWPCCAPSVLCAAKIFGRAASSRCTKASRSRSCSPTARRINGVAARDRAGTVAAVHAEVLAGVGSPFTSAR